MSKVSFAEFSDMQREWNALLDESSCRSVFLTWEWIEAWWRQLSSELVILTARMRGELVGIAPFYMEILLPFAEWRIELLQHKVGAMGSAARRVVEEKFSVKAMVDHSIG